MTEFDKNGYVVEVIRSWSFGWRMFYHLTGLVPFSIRGVIQHPGYALRDIRRGLRIRVRRRLGI